MAAVRDFYLILTYMDNMNLFFGEKRKVANIWNTHQPVDFKNEEFKLKFITVKVPITPEQL